ncbi:hypothetical protein BDQ17DRAFT_873520 [Cyathus striatus]|nr:hypothetical protein BDQ17DRAFT_873520 [Cyathus striatus]
MSLLPSPRDSHPPLSAATTPLYICHSCATPSYFKLTRYHHPVLTRGCCCVYSCVCEWSVLGSCGRWGCTMGMLVDHSLKSLSPFNQVHPPTLSSSSCCSLYSFQIHSAIFWGHFHRDLVKAVLAASLASCCMLLGGMFIVILQIPTMTMRCWLSSTFIWDSTPGQVRGAIVLDTLSSLVLEFLACLIRYVKVPMPTLTPPTPAITPPLAFLKVLTLLQMPTLPRASPTWLNHRHCHLQPQWNDDNCYPHFL